MKTGLVLNFLNSKPFSSLSSVFVCGLYSSTRYYSVDTQVREKFPHLGRSRSLASVHVCFRPRIKEKLTSSNPRHETHLQNNTYVSLDKVGFRKNNTYSTNQQQNNRPNQALKARGFHRHV